MWSFTKHVDSDEEVIEQRYYDKDGKEVLPRANILWENIEPNYIAHLLGISLNGLEGEEAKLMLKKKKVWPYYYPQPNDVTAFDRFPVELMSTCDVGTKCERKIRTEKKQSKSTFVRAYRTITSSMKLPEFKSIRALTTRK